LKTALYNLLLSVVATTHEWIEVFNQNNFEVDLSNWQITDTLGKTNTYTFPAGTKIPAQGFLILSRPTTKITLNNDGDELLLTQPNGNILDSVNYEKAPRGQSYNRTESDWAWSTILTPGLLNQIPAPEIREKESSKEVTEKTTPQEKIQPKMELATIGEQFLKGGGSFSPILVAFSIAFFSGTIILILKKRIEKLRKIE
jgi:hypothetical protein